MEIIGTESGTGFAVFAKTVDIQCIVHNFHRIWTVLVGEAVCRAVLIGQTDTCYGIAESSVPACAEEVKCARWVGTRLFPYAPDIAVIECAHALPYRTAGVAV